VYVNITYDIHVEMVRGGFSKNITTKDEFIVEVPVGAESAEPFQLPPPHPFVLVAAPTYQLRAAHSPTVSSCSTSWVHIRLLLRCLQTIATVEPEPLSFEITPESLENVRRVSSHVWLGLEQDCVLDALLRHGCMARLGLRRGHGWGWDMAGAGAWLGWDVTGAGSWRGQLLHWFYLPHAAWIREISVGWGFP
jgi:hypothetical protein